MSVVATNAKILIPQKELKSMRKLSSESELNQALKILATTLERPIFESKKDRVLYFKKEASKQDLKARAAVMAHLNALDDKGKVEITILASMTEILNKEIQAVFGISEREASELVNNAQNQLAA